MVQALDQLFHIAQKGMEFSSSPHKPQLIAELYSMIRRPVPGLDSIVLCDGTGLLWS